MIVVNVTVEIDPANLLETKAGIAKMEQLSRAEEGCQDYTFSVELNDETKVRITEKWDNLECLLAHFQAPHMGDFQALMAKYPPKGMDGNFYEATAFTPPGM
jgi:quinol monooxygenase YgiN